MTRDSQECTIKVDVLGTIFGFIRLFIRSESRISSSYLEVISISLIYSLTYSRKKELLFRLSRGLNRLTCVTRQIRGDSKLRD